MKKFVGIMCAILIVVCSLPVGAMSEQQWDEYWAESDLASAVHITPGHDESERIFTWFGEGEGTVKISRRADLNAAKVFYASSVRTPEGDCSFRAEVSSLESGCTYYYRCESKNFKSETGTFSTSDGTGFSAVYVTDVHMSGESLSDEGLRDGAYIFERTLENAVEKSGATLLISGGDQASSALRCEYSAFVSSPIMKGMTTAFSVGNHDRKNVNYRYFVNTPYTSYSGTSSYMGRDYCFVKDGVLFMMLDTNCTDANAHRNFMSAAVKANPDVNWRVAVFHHDLFGGRIEHRESENKLLRLLLVPLMDEFKVDLVLTGHSHYYTMSDIIYGNKAVLETDKLTHVTDAPGTLYLTSGSITRPRELEDGVTPPLGDKIGFDYLSDEAVYNILTFSESELKIESYTLESDTLFNSFTLEKTSAQGGHRTSLSWIYNGFFRVISSIVAVFNNLGNAYDWYEDFGTTVNPVEAAFGAHAH